jgi:hypothetical protein
MEREKKVQQGKRDRISSDKLAVSSIHEVTRYTKIHIRYNNLIFKVTIFNNTSVS